MIPCLAARLVANFANSACKQRIQTCGFAEVSSGMLAGKRELYRLDSYVFVAKYLRYIYCLITTFLVSLLVFRIADSVILTATTVRSNPEVFNEIMLFIMHRYSRHMKSKFPISQEPISAAATPHRHLISVNVHHFLYS